MVWATTPLLQTILPSDIRIGRALLYWRHLYVFPSHFLTLQLKSMFEATTAALLVFHSTTVEPLLSGFMKLFQFFLKDLFCPWHLF